MVAYSPLGRGFLTGEVRKFDDFDETDFRRRMPRFQPDVFEENLKLVAAVEQIAKRKGVTAGQVAIAWTRYHGAVPIPGATKEGRVLENSKDCSLTADEVAEIQTILDRFPIQGQRYGGEAEKHLNQ